MKHKTLIFLICVVSISCKGKITREISIKNQKPLFEKNISDPIESRNTLFAFVGEKIAVTEIPVSKWSMDLGFKAKYKILLKVYGNYSSDTIEFIGFDHYGFPEFAKFKNVLLFVSDDSGRLYHEKYMYNDVYRTKDGRWAGPYRISDYDHPYIKAIEVNPEIIDFQNEVTFPLKGISEDFIKRIYPAPTQTATNHTAGPMGGILIIPIKISISETKYPSLALVS